MLIFAHGARGPIVRHIQRRLQARTFFRQPLNGIFDDDTVEAVRLFQASRELPVTGEVDDAMWPLLSIEPLPSLRDRCLSVTAALDGYDFDFVRFDGNGITFGVLGFPLRGGALERMIRTAWSRDQLQVRACFEGKTNELLRMLDAPLPRQMLWAEELTEPWKTAFARFGDSEVGRRLQLERVDEDYYSRALATAKAFGFTTDLGVALVFDILVQTGLSDAVVDAVRAKYKPELSEAEVRALLANAVSDATKPNAREAVRNRKLAIATGRGNVNGLDIELRNWGLGAPASSPAGSAASSPPPP